MREPATLAPDLERLAREKKKLLFDAATALGVDTETYERYATKRWGQGWKKAAGGRKRALEDITHFQDDGAGFVEKVKGELEVWA